GNSGSDDTVSTSRDVDSGGIEGGMTTGTEQDAADGELAMGSGDGSSLGSVCTSNRSNVSVGPFPLEAASSGELAFSISSIASSESSRAGVFDGAVSWSCSTKLHPTSRVEFPVFFGFSPASVSASPSTDESKAAATDSENSSGETLSASKADRTSSADGSTSTSSESNSESTTSALSSGERLSTSEADAG